MTTKPKISIIIPTFNCGKYIVNAIISALNQTYKNIEVVIIDDGSTDDTFYVVKPFADKNLIRYYRQENMGVAEARNMGIRVSDGEFIAYVDADDEIDRKLVERCFNQLSDEFTDFCITDITRVFVVGNVLKKETCRSPVPKGDFVCGILNEDFSLRTPFIRKQVIIDLGMYDSSMKTREDWDMNIRMILNNHSFSYVKEPLYHYHIRMDSLMRGDRATSYNCTLALLEKHHKVIARSGDKNVQKIYAVNMWWLGRKYFNDKISYKLFAYCLFQSIRYGFLGYWLINNISNKYRSILEKIR